MQMRSHRAATRRIALTTAAALAAGSLAAIGAAAAAAAAGPVTAADKTLFAYARCMRDKGVKIPDPAKGKDGKFAFPAISKSITDAAGVRAKAQACAAAAGALGSRPGGSANGNGPGGGRGGFGGPQTPAQQAALKKFQDCLKANGVTTAFPGPGQRPPAAGTTTGARANARPAATTTSKSGKVAKPAIAGNGPDAGDDDAGPRGGRGPGAGGGPGGRGFGGGLRGGGGFGDAKTQAAFQKCRALLPARQANAG